MVSGDVVPGVCLEWAAPSTRVDISPYRCSGNLDLWWLRHGKTIELQPDCFERQRKVAQSARWGYATAPNDPSRVFPRNGFEDIVCGIHPRELLRIEILPILILVSLVR